MPSISVPAAIGIGAGVSGVGSVASGLIGAGASKSAASTQAAAATQAEQLQLSMFNTTQQNLQPFISAGTTALGTYQGLTGTGPGGNPLTAPLTTPFQPTQAQLAATPGYQFTLQQGQEATQNAFAGQGLASSGAALKGGANYAEGLASTTYQQQFQNYLTQNQQIASMVGAPINVGESAAAGLGTTALGTGAQAGNTLTSGAAATAAGTVGAANAATNALNGLGSNASNFALLTSLNNSGLFGSGAAAGGGGIIQGGNAGGTLLNQLQ